MFCLGVCKRSAICTGSEKRVGNGEISPATVRNYIKAVKLFCEMNDIVGLNWKKDTTHAAAFVKIKIRIKK
jgi:hypothetical protein